MIQAFLKKGEKFQINNLIYQLKEKEEKTQPKVRRREEIIKIREDAFNHAVWNKLHSIRMHLTTLHGLHFIQSQCMESTAFYQDALGHAA